MTSIEEGAVPTNLTWQDCLICEGNISFYCSKCKTKQDRSLDIFQNERPKDLIETEKKIFYGREIKGKALAVVVALIAGSLLVAISGHANLWVGVVCAGIYMIVKPFFIAKYMKEMQVWKIRCDDCGETNYIATDGIAAAVGTILT